MLAERRELLEQEIIKQKKLCGQLYKVVMLEQVASEKDIEEYYALKEGLSNLMTDLEVVEQMIADGHK